MARTCETTRAAFEPLESRLMLSGDVMVEVLGYDLVIRGDHAANAVNVSQAEGKWIVEGLSRGGAATTINGRSRVTLDSFIKNIRVDMGWGDDSLSLGHEHGWTTAIDGDLDVNMGGGRGEFFTGRIATDTAIHYAGPVMVGGDVDIRHEDNAYGSVILAGLHCDGNVSVHLGEGFGEKWFVMEDTIPAYRPALRLPYAAPPYSTSRIAGNVTVTNPVGETHVLIGSCTVDGLLRVTTGHSDDTIDVLSARLNHGARFETFGGADRITIGYPDDYGTPVDPTFIYGLTIETGNGDDAVALDYLQVWKDTRINLGAGDVRQSLTIATRGYFNTGTLGVGAGMETHVQFGSRAGAAYQTYVAGNMQVVVDGPADIWARGVVVSGVATFYTGDFDDIVNITDSRFKGGLGVVTMGGSDMVYVGDQVVSQTPYETGRVWCEGNLAIYAGSGTDYVSVGDVGVDYMTLIDMGDTGGTRQILALAQGGGRFRTGDLGIGAEGGTIAYIGRHRSDGGFAVTVYGTMVIDFSASAGNDWVLMRATHVEGPMRMHTGGGWDFVGFDGCIFMGDVGVETGTGRDGLYIAGTTFIGEAHFATGTGDDRMHVQDSSFGLAATFDGGDGRDAINLRLEDRNDFLGSLVVDVEERL